MSMIEAGIGPLIELLKSAIKKATSLRSARKRKKAISTAIMEMLKLHPDFNTVKAALAAADITGAIPDPDMFCAKSMAEKTAQYHGFMKSIKKYARQHATKSPKKDVVMYLSKGSGTLSKGFSATGKKAIKRIR